MRLLVDAREPRRAIPLARRLARIEGQQASHLEAMLWVDLAESERAEGRTQVARKALRRALRADSQNVRAWLALGLVEAELGNAKRALAAWRRVPEIDRRAGPDVYPRLAATFAALGVAARPNAERSWPRESHERAQAFRNSSASPETRASTRTLVPSGNSPSRIFTASGSCTMRWITRFSGRAP